MFSIQRVSYVAEWWLDFLHGIKQEQVDLYVNKHYHEDVWTKSAVKQNLVFEGNVILGEELVSRELLLESKIYKECLSRDGNLAQLMTSLVFGMDSTNSMSAACSFFRGLHRHPLTFGGSATASCGRGRFGLSLIQQNSKSRANCFTNCGSESLYHDCSNNALNIISGSQAFSPAALL